MMRLLKVVGVMGSGRERHDELSRPLGALLASMNVHILTGGGQGAMASVAEGFVSVEARQGLSLGVLPGLAGEVSCEAPSGYPNRFIELPIRTHLSGRGAEGGTANSRNAINVATADALVILPGGAGTASEVRLALQFRRPAIGLGGGGAREGIAQAATLQEVEAFLRDALGLCS